MEKLVSRPEANNSGLPVFEKLNEFLLPLLQTLCALWIAAVTFPASSTLISFAIGIFILFVIINGCEKTILHTASQQLGLFQGLMLLVLLLVLVAVLDLFLPHTTLNLCIAGVALFCIYLYCFNRHRKLAVLFYSALWCLAVPLAFNLQGKDIETSTWLVYCGFFFWTVVYRSTQQLIPLAEKESISLLGIAFLQVFSFGFLILMGIFSGQSSFFFIGLLITLLIFIAELDCINKLYLKAAYLLNLPVAALLLAGVILSYHF
jgi:4-hydroxybenzoate polyprenyltransferase